MKKLIFNICLGVCLASPVQANWASLADAPTKNSYYREISVNRDGTFKSVDEISKVILTEVGRSQEASFVLNYNDKIGKMDVLSAKTMYQGKEYKLTKDLIEDKPLASSYEGFDQLRQILLAFPKAEIGATVSAKYRFALKKTQLDNFYAELFTFGGDELVTKVRIKITSKLPLYVLVNDPEQVLKVTEHKKPGVYSLEIVLTKPIYKSVVNESESAMVNPKQLTWVSVSSLNQWEDLAAKYGKMVEKVYTQELPRSFLTILEAAKKQTNEVDKINTVTSLLSDKIRYMGDWRTLDGHLVPRDLAVISKTQLGDCKDFAAATAAILTKLGFRAQMVAVLRGLAKPSWEILPSLEAFNHAIVKVTNRQGVVYWIDPTNFESMAGGIFPDIAGKMAMVSDPKQPSYERIPQVNPQHAKVHSQRELTILGNNRVLENGTLLLANEATLGLTGAELKVSEEMIKNIIYYALADYTTLDEENKKWMVLPKLNSRIVKDISLSYSLERDHEVLQTNVGPALKLTYGGIISDIYNLSQDNVADALVNNGYPMMRMRQTIIKGVMAKGVGALNQELTTPWLYVKRSCSINANHNLQIDDTMVLYKNIIPSADFKQPEFIALKDWLKNNFKDVIIVLETIKN